VAEYVYGIVETSAKPPAARGIADAPLRLISGETACALVSELTAEELRLGREEMLAHARVLEEALANGTVLPMRFGVLMESPDEVKERLLDDHSSELTEQLERFQDHVEMNVRGVYVEETLMREIVREDEQIARLREMVRSYPEDATYARRMELGELVAVGIADETPRALSAVYCYHDPDRSRLSLGTYNVLRAIEYARERGVAYVYLGYCVAGCESLRYKARFRPQERLVGAATDAQAPRWEPS